MDYKFDLKLDTVTDDFCFSVKKQKYIEIDGQREYIGEPDRRAFSPGQFEELAEYAPEFEAMARTIWTPDVVAAWESEQKAKAERFAR